MPPLRSGVRHQLASLPNQLEGEKLTEKDYRDVLKALEPISATSDPAKLSKIYGSRFAKAWELLKEKRVKKYMFNSSRVMWIVVGKEREYLIYPAVGYCGCDDFFFAVMDGTALACRHLIAQRLAQELSDYDVVEAEDRLFDSLMEDKRRLSPSEEGSGLRGNRC